MTLFQALYGRLPPIVPNYQVGTSPVHEVDKTLLSRHELLSQLKRNLVAIITFECHVEFKEGDMVFLRL